MVVHRRNKNQLALALTSSQISIGTISHSQLNKQTPKLNKILKHNKNLQINRICKINRHFRHHLKTFQHPRVFRLKRRSHKQLNFKITISFNRTNWVINNKNLIINNLLKGLILALVLHHSSKILLLHLTEQEMLLIHQTLPRQDHLPLMLLSQHQMALIITLWKILYQSIILIKMIPWLNKLFQLYTAHLISLVIEVPLMRLKAQILLK
jgi:hypothetical protein